MNRENSKKKECDYEMGGIVLTVGAVVEKPGSTVANKTGNWRSMRPIKDPKVCIKCGRCWVFCPENAISPDIETNYDYCKGCGICAEECPVKAIKMEKEKK